jgi:hypothetical protein
MAIMLSPIPLERFTTSAPKVYTADQYGVIVNVTSAQDVADLVAAGCAVLTPPPTDLLFTLKSANFNTTADQLLTPTFNGKYRPKRFVIDNASISLTTAAGGFYTGAGKTGTTLVAAGQAYSALTTALLALEATLNSAATVLAAATPIYFALTTAQGAPATGDIRVYGDVLT